MVYMNVESIQYAFDMGISFKEDEGKHNLSIPEAYYDFYSNHFAVVDTLYRGFISPKRISTIVDQMTSVSLLGYMIPSVAVYTPELQTHLANAMRKKLCVL